jgi:hypothetical protein
MISNFFRAIAWILLVGIVVMTVVPPGARVVTGTPHDVEHAAIFLITGFALGLGYQEDRSLMPMRVLDLRFSRSHSGRPGEGEVTAALSRGCVDGDQR